MKPVFALIFAAAPFLPLSPLSAAEPAGALNKARVDKAEPVNVKGKSAAPCCSIAAINSATGAVTLKNLKSGQTFTVNVASKARVNKLRVGQRVDKNL